VEKNEKPRKKIKIEFKRKLVKLGIPEDETENACELDIDWISASQKMVIYCTESKCEFKTENVDYRCLDSHYIKVHKYGSYPCTEDNCKYIALTKKTLKIHLSKFHSDYQKVGGGHRCSFPNCNKGFKSNLNLLQHEAIHKNELKFNCYFCPYKTEHTKDFTTHVAIHFKEERFKCEICNLVSRTKADLIIHVKTKHDDDSFKCTLCAAIFQSEKLHQSHMNPVHKMPNESELYRTRIEAQITEEDMEKAFPNRK